MFTFEVLLWMIKTIFPDYDIQWVGPESRKVLERELDFQQEALNSEKAAKNSQGNDDYYFPKVYWKSTTNKILTTEFIHGCKITNQKAIKEYGFEPKQAIKKLTQLMGEQLFVHGFLHGDPHPGNVFIRPNPKNKSKLQVVLLDHGLYKELSEEFREKYCAIYWAAATRKNNKVIEKYCMELGISPHNTDLFVTMILMRPPQEFIRKHFGVEWYQMHQVIGNLESINKFGTFAELTKEMPKEMLIILRNANILRSINHELGAPINRCAVLARESLKGLTIQNRNSSIITSLKNKIGFWFIIIRMDLTYKFAKLYLKIMHLFGYIPNQFSVEGYIAADWSDRPY
eukprot:TRINITY_DN6984_c0_g1_i1.p1 TRINITY_DN6984_c0_g1~~TRINITY_DN6984_c0_g1_i1.p1  ORF type:complete len:343 (+),score=113.37 TRINITY_DN6984_c0_g1_i1:128-1156(+)